MLEVDMQQMIQIKYIFEALQQLKLKFFVKVICILLIHYNNKRTQAICRCDIFQKSFLENFDFSTNLRDFFIKKPSQLPQIGNMPLQFYKTVCFAIRSHFLLQKYNNMNFFSYPKIFQKIQTAIFRLLLMPGSSTIA